MSTSLTIDDIAIVAGRSPIHDNAVKAYLEATLAKPSQALINVCFETYAKRFDCATVHEMSYAMMEAVLRQMLTELHHSEAPVSEDAA